ncbi:unnamed protein product [Meloidogyne enterolobii]|uniref:Uncharacterized protein n=1 Tax=Meloidogyne enterolobii TaxID=390850 RepID=A0ACB0ZFQ8_MELEN
MDRRSTEALMNAIVEKDGKGAAVQLMFPAIYKLSCRMNVRFFPYDQQNCSFIISSWTHDSATINYHYERPTVNLLNFAQNDEWTVISFNFERIEQQFKCCKNPWTMLYAHLSIWYCPLPSLQLLQSLDFLHLLQAAAKEMKSFIWELIL